MKNRLDALRRAISLTALGAALAVSTPALGQDGAAGEEDPASLDAESGNVITVTAQFR